MTEQPRRQADASPAGKSGALATITAENFDVMEAIGGVRGILESVVPTVLFLGLYVALDDLNKALLVAVATALLAIGIRIVLRTQVTPALGGLFAIALSAFIAWRSGEASDFFVWGLVTNAAYLLVILLSIAVRWPLLGVFIGLIRGDVSAWRTDPNQLVTKRRYYRVTWLWVGLFAARLMVQLPLYLAHATEPLGIARLAMGVPFFALIAWFSWMLVRGLPPVASAKELAE